HVEGEGDAVEVGEGQHPVEGALQLPDVVGDVGSDVREDVVGGFGRLVGRLLAQDGQAGLEVGGLDVGDEAPPEAAAQPVLQGGHGLGRAVGGDHDLTTGGVQVVEGVEELLL